MEDVLSLPSGDCMEVAVGEEREQLAIMTPDLLHRYVDAVFRVEALDKVAPGSEEVIQFIRGFAANTIPS